MNNSTNYIIYNFNHFTILIPVAILLLCYICVISCNLYNNYNNNNRKNYISS